MTNYESNTYYKFAIDIRFYYAAANFNRGKSDHYVFETADDKTERYASFVSGTIIRTSIFEEITLYFGCTPNSRQH